MLKIFQFEGGGHFLCLNDDRNWGLLIGDDFSSFEKNGAILGLLPVLDIGYEVFTEKINALGLSAAVDATFPMFDLLKYPFENERVFWAEQSLEWIKKGGFSDALKPWAYTIPVSWMPQKLMHGFRAAFDIPKYMLRR